MIQTSRTEKKRTLPETEWSEYGVVHNKMTKIGGQFYLYLNVNCKWTANRNQAQLFNIEIQKILSK